MMKRYFIYKLIALIAATFITADCFAIDLNESLRYPDLVKRISESHERLWTSPGTGASLRSGLYELIENSDDKGLNKQRYHYTSLQSERTTKYYQNPEEIAAIESYYTDALVAYSMDMTGISGIDKWISYNGLTKENPGAETEKLVTAIAAITNQQGLQRFAASLEPGSNEYRTLSAELKKQTALGNTTNIEKLKVSLLYLRWIHHYAAQKYIVVNIPSAMLHYYENGADALQMKVVVGKPSTKTPRFATYCHQLILYPYWHVPQ